MEFKIKLFSTKLYFKNIKVEDLKSGAKNSFNELKLLAIKHKQKKLYIGDIWNCMKHYSYLPVISVINPKIEKIHYKFTHLDVDIIKDILLPLLEKTKNWIDCLIAEYPQIFLPETSKVSFKIIWNVKSKRYNEVEHVFKI